MSLPLIIRELLPPAQDELRLDAEVLLARVIHQPRSFLYAHPEYDLSSSIEQEFHVLWQRRLAGEPLAYIVREKEFWGLNLQVDRHTLIPRPETELLVEIALTQMKQEHGRLLEVGTGSGAIACALATERPTWELIATDISEPALQMAAANLHPLVASSSVQLIAADGFSCFSPHIFDVIVSNPPYIAADDPHLSALEYEPKLALVADEQGFALIRELIVTASYYLRAGGMLILEHGYDQTDLCRSLDESSQGLRYLKTYPDLSGLPRVSVFEVYGDLSK